MLDAEVKGRLSGLCEGRLVKSTNLLVKSTNMLVRPLATRFLGPLWTDCAEIFCVDSGHHEKRSERF